MVKTFDITIYFDGQDPEIQKLLFKHGFHWGSGTNSCNHTIRSVYSVLKLKKGSTRIWTAHGTITDILDYIGTSELLKTLNTSSDTSSYTTENNNMSNVLDKYIQTPFASPVLYHGRCLTEFTEQDYMKALRNINADIKNLEDLEDVEAVAIKITKLKANKDKLAKYFNEYMENNNEK